MRLIDADALISFIDMGHLRNPLEACYSERDVVDMLESRPVLTLDDLRPRGRWIVYGVNSNDAMFCRCSECLSGECILPNLIPSFCWKCGAKLDLEDADGQN